MLSGKGGVGKSSITTQLALSLSLAGHSVGILDVDLTGPSIPRLFGLEDAKITQAPGGWLPVQVHPSQTLKPIDIPASTDTSVSNSNGSSSSHGPTGTNGATSETRISALYLMSLGFLLPSRSSAVVWRGPKKTAMVRQFLTDVLWPAVDFLLIDTPPGTSDEHISLAEQLLKVASSSETTAVQAAGSNGAGGRIANPHLAGAVVVTTPQAVATSDVRKELNFCAKVGIKPLGVVENMSGYVCECCGVSTNIFGSGGGEVMSRDFGVRFLGGVPIDGQWGVLVEEGKRPRYNTVANDDAEGEGERDSSGERDEDAVAGVKEGGLLVDKYRSCSLREIFGEIVRGLVGIVEEERAKA